METTYEKKVIKTGGMNLRYRGHEYTLCKITEGDRVYYIVGTKWDDNPSGDQYDTLKEARDVFDNEVDEYREFQAEQAAQRRKWNGGTGRDRGCSVDPERSKAISEGIAKAKARRERWAKETGVAVIKSRREYELILIRATYRRAGVQTPEVYL